MSELPDALVRIVQAFIDDEDLGLWFESVMEAAPAEQAAEFRQMASRMRNLASGEELAHAISLLAIPSVSAGVLAAYHDLKSAG